MDVQTDASGVHEAPVAGGASELVPLGAGGLLFLPLHRVTVMTGLPPAFTSSWTTARLEGRPTLPTAALW